MYILYSSLLLIFLTKFSFQNFMYSHFCFIYLQLLKPPRPVSPPPSTLAFRWKKTPNIYCVLPVLHRQDHGIRRCVTPPCRIQTSGVGPGWCAEPSPLSPSVTFKCFSAKYANFVDYLTPINIIMHQRRNT